MHKMHVPVPGVEGEGLLVGGVSEAGRGDRESSAADAHTHTHIICTCSFGFFIRTTHTHRCVCVCFQVRAAVSFLLCF